MEDQNKLVNALKQFNRKERYLLLDRALEKPSLSKAFLCDIKEKIGILVPDDAYWAIDYHFDWLAGAIAVFSGAKRKFKNEPCEKGQNRKRVVQGNQEDSDLLVAFENTIILVECKAGGEWNGQIDSKLERIKILKTFIKKHWIDSPIEIYFAILCAPEKRPKEKHRDLPWLELVYKDGEFKRVRRCDPYDEANTEYLNWEVT